MITQILWLENKLWTQSDWVDNLYIQYDCALNNNSTSYYTKQL